MCGLEQIDGARHPRLDVAEGAGAGAGVAKDHHRRMLLCPAFADIRTGGFFAHRMQVEFAHQLARFGVTGAGRRLDADPVGLALALAGSRCRGDWSGPGAHIVPPAPLLTPSTSPKARP